MRPVGEYEAAGLYDPVTHAGTDRLELLRWLESMGFTVADMKAANDSDGLSGLAGDRRIVPGERLSRAESIARAGLDASDFDALATGFGFVPITGAPAGELGFTADEVDAIALVAAMSPMFSLPEALGLVRVIGSSLGRIADASVSLFLADVERPHLSAGEGECALAVKVYEATGLLDDLGANLDPILRRQVLQAVERTRRASMGSDRLEYRFAVGFVDLVGFTERSASMSASTLATFIREFEGKAHDVTTSSGARLVKLIGDEVMFVATDPGAACRAAAGLMSAFAGVDEGVIPRGGLAYGAVLVRGGDYYGSVVNLASRLVDEAVPLEVLVTEEFADATVGCSFEPAGRRTVKGFADPVGVRSLVMGAGQPAPPQGSP